MEQTSSSSTSVNPSWRCAASCHGADGEMMGAERGDSLKLWSTAVTQYVWVVVGPGFGSTYVGSHVMVSS